MYNIVTIYKIAIDNYTSYFYIYVEHVSCRHSKSTELLEAVVSTAIPTFVAP